MMPGRAPAQGGQPQQPFGPQLKAALVQAAPLFSAMAAGYSSGRGPYAYMDQGIAGMQAMQKQKRDEEAAAAAAAAFGGLVPGGMGPAGVSTNGGGGEPFTYTPSQPMPKANVGVMGGGKGGLGFAGLPAADTGAMGAEGGMSFQTPGSGDPTLGLIKQFEGFRETPYWDVNALRTGYGSDTVTMADGSVQRVGEGTRVTQADADRDLQRRVQTEFMPIAARAVGEEAFAGLAPNQKAALTSIAYNYGELPSSVAAAVRSGDPRAAAEAIAALGSHNGGVNADRRRKEAEFYLSGSTGGNVTMSAKGEGAAPSVADPLADPYVQKLMQVMAMPGLTDEQRSVVQLQLQTRMGQLTATAKTEALPAGFRELDLQAQAGGLVPGTPEYQNFMLSGGAGATGGEGPAAFQALHMQALAAGFTEGSPEYQNFMATRGAGLVAESKALGEAKGSAIAGAPAEIAAADETLGFIDEVRKHPGLDAGTGMTSVFNQVPGTSGYDFQNRVNQLLSGGFLTAIDQLRGMGALSNAEGQTATRAISRMDTATSKEEFLAALDDYERVVKQGRERAAGKLESAPATSVAPVKGVTQSGVEWSIGE